MLDAGPLEVLLECAMMMEEDDPEETGAEELALDVKLLPCELIDEPCEDCAEEAEDKAELPTLEGALLAMVKLD